jgi:hypothetical protein
VRRGNDESRALRRGGNWPGCDPLAGEAQSHAERRPGQRERERERRVSDADASYNATTTGARTPKHMIPKRKHAKNNSLSETTRSLSQGPRQNKMLASTTKTDPKPDLMSRLYTLVAYRHRPLIH